MVFAFAALATIALWVVLANAPDPKARRIRIDDEDPRHRRG
jgi:hypothetical protein